MGQGLSPLQQRILHLTYANWQRYAYSVPVYHINASVYVPHVNDETLYVQTHKQVEQQLLHVLQPYASEPLTANVGADFQSKRFVWDGTFRKGMDDRKQALKGVIDDRFYACYGLPLQVKIEFDALVCWGITVLLATAETYIEAEAIRDELRAHSPGTVGEYPIDYDIYLHTTTTEQTPYDKIWNGILSRQAMGTHITSRDLLCALGKHPPTSSAKASLSRALTRLWARHLLWKLRSDDLQHVRHLALTPEGYQWCIASNG